MANPFDLDRPGGDGHRREPRPGSTFCPRAGRGRRRPRHHQPHAVVARAVRRRRSQSLGRRGGLRRARRARTSAASSGRWPTRSAQFGRIDILVNNAGCNIRKPAVEVTWDDWNEIVDTNLRGTFFVAQAVAWHMIPRRYGRIINIGSVTCVAGYAGLAPYGASRGGIKQLTMSLAARLGPARHHRQLPRPRLVQDGAEPRAVRRPGLGRIPVRAHPARPPGRAGRPRRRAVALGLRRRPLHHRPNAPGRRRHLGRSAAGAAERK